MTDDLRAVAAAAARDLADAPAAQVVRWAAERFGDDFVVAASMQDTVLVHLASQAAPGVQVVFLDTGYHFAQTVQTRDRVAAEYDVRVLDVRPRLTVAQQDELVGSGIVSHGAIVPPRGHRGNACRDVRTTVWVCQPSPAPWDRSPAGPRTRTASGARTGT